MLWNCEHRANRFLTPHAANWTAGSWLHALSWLGDDDIGELPLTWNWLAGVNELLPFNEVPAGVHYTLGIPSWKGYENSPYSDLWRKTLAKTSRVSTGERA